MNSGKDQRTWNKYVMNGLTGDRGKKKAMQPKIFLVTVCNIFLEIRNPHVMLLTADRLVLWRLIRHKH